MTSDSNNAEPRRAQILVDTGKGSITLDDLGRTQKGMAHWMADIGPRISNCWHAAQGGNWELSRYYLRTAIKLMRHSVILRPAYAGDMDAFISKGTAPVLEAIGHCDLPRFESAYEAMIELANDYHTAWNFGYIRCTIPTTPPMADLDFTPPGSNPSG